MNWISKEKILLILLGLIVGFIFGELLVRKFVVIEKTLPDFILGQRGNPKAGYDGNGFRNEKLLIQADIVAIGNSQTEGNNAVIKEAWPQQLGEISGKSIYQMALGGYGPIHYWYLFHEALKLDPGLIIVAFYTGNDLSETVKVVYNNDYWKNFRTPDFVFERNESPNTPNIRQVFYSGLLENSLSYKILEVRNWLRSKSSLYLFLGRSTRAIREKLNFAETTEKKLERIRDFAKNNPDIAFFYNREPVETILSPLLRYDSVNLDNPETAEGFRITKDVFKLMRERTKENKTEFVIVLIPTKEAAYIRHMEGRGEEVPKPLLDLFKTEENLRLQIMNFCKDEKLSCFDLTDDLAKALDNGLVIYPKSTDGHPINTGYKFIAESIYKFLKTKKIINDDNF